MDRDAGLGFEADKPFLGFGVVLERCQLGAEVDLIALFIVRPRSRL